MRSPHGRTRPTIETCIATAIAAHMTYLFRASEFTPPTSASMECCRKKSAHITSIRHEYAKVWDQLLRNAQKAGALRSDIKVVLMRRAVLDALNETVEWSDPDKAGKHGCYTLSAFTELLINMLPDGLSANGFIATNSAWSAAESMSTTSDRQKMIQAFGHRPRIVILPGDRPHAHDPLALSSDDRACMQRTLHGGAKVIHRQVD